MQFLISIFLFVAFAIAAKPYDDPAKQVTGTATFSMTKGGDAAVSITLKNGSKKKLVNPNVRITFYDSTGSRLVSDAKTFFTTLAAGQTRKLETRLWRDIPETADSTAVELEYGEFR